MEARFATYQEASLYALERQAEGYFAKVCHDAGGGLWGDGSAGGYLVIVSETDGEYQDEIEPPSRAEQMLIAATRGGILAIMGVGAGWAALELTAYLFQGGLFPVLLFIAALVCAFYVLAGWSTVLTAAVGKSRKEERSLFYPFLFSFIGAILVGLTLWMF